MIRSMCLHSVGVMVSLRRVSEAHARVIKIVLGKAVSASS